MFSENTSADRDEDVETLSLLSFYTLLLSVLPQFIVALTVNFALSPFIIVMFAGAMGPVILYSGFPPSFFGLQTANWKSALGFSIAVSPVFLAVAVLLKWILIHTTETFAGLSLFGVADVKVDMQSGDDVAALLGRGRALPPFDADSGIRGALLLAGPALCSPQRDRVLAQAMVHPCVEPRLCSGAFAHQFRVRGRGLHSWAVLELDLCELAYRGICFSLHDRRRGYLTAGD
jgi:hypothetical protein